MMSLDRLRGGATPFADGLLKAWQLIRAARAKSPGLRPVLVIISDGQANVPIIRNPDRFSPSEHPDSVLLLKRGAALLGRIVTCSPSAVRSGESPGARRRLSPRLPETMPSNLPSGEIDQTWAPADLNFSMGELLSTA